MLSATVKEPKTPSCMYGRLRLKMIEQHCLSHSDMSIVRSANHDCDISDNAFECFRRTLQPPKFRLAEC